jgi:hypothetical protein
MAQKQIDANKIDGLVIVDPAAELEHVSSITARRLTSLKGVRVGMIDNSKHNALPMLKEIERVLATQFGIGSFDYYRKDNPSIPMPSDAILAMAGRCDAVIHGVAD